MIAFPEAGFLFLKITLDLSSGLILTIELRSRERKSRKEITAELLTDSLELKTGKWDKSSS